MRLKAIAEEHGLLRIFDEVISGFGRFGAPFAVDYFGVTPDMITTMPPNRRPVGLTSSPLL